MSKLSVRKIAAATGFSLFIASLPLSIMAQESLTVANLRVTAIGDKTATVQWSTNFPSNGTVEYGATNRLEFAVGFTGEQRTAHVVTLTNLLPETTYYYRVVSRTSAEEAASFTQTFKTTKLVDRDTPVVTDVAIPYQGPTVAVVQWRTTEAADSLVLYGPTSSYGSQRADGARVTVHDVTLSGLKPQTTYHFQVKSKDAQGNLGISPNFTFRTTADTGALPRLELTAIRPISTNDPALTDSSAEISWRTQTLADGLVRWGTSSALGRVVAAPPPRDFAHAVRLLSLQPDTTYFFQVESRDIFGVTLRSDVYRFTTHGQFRPTPPLPPGQVLGVTSAQDLLFYASFNRGLDADFALGNGTGGTFGVPRSTGGSGGIRGGAVELPRESQVQYAGSNNISAAAGTIAFWFKPNWSGGDGIHHVLFENNPTYQQVADKYFMIGKTGTQGIGKRHLEEKNKLYFALEDDQDTDYRYFVQNADITVGQWHFLTVTWSYFGGIGKIYLNGQPTAPTAYRGVDKKTVPLEQTPGNLFPTFYAGSRGNTALGSTNGDVTLDELAIFGRVLSDDEIKLLYAEGVARYLPKPSRPPAPAPTPTPTPAPPGRVLGVSTLQYTPASALLRAKGQPDVYAIMNGQKHLVSGPSSFAAYGYRWSDVRTVAPEVLEIIPDARLVRTPADATISYLYQRPQRLWLKLAIPSPTVFVSYPGNFWGNVVTINEIDLSSYPDVRLIQASDSPETYQLDGATKRLIGSDAVFDALRLPRSHVAQVNRVHLDFYPSGEPLK